MGAGRPPRERGWRFAVALALSLGALGYAAAVLVVAWRAPDKGFLSFTGQRIVTTTPGGPGDRAGLARGDVVVGIDGAPVGSTLDYAFRLLRRSPGETVAIEVLRPDGSRHAARVDLERARPPLHALAAFALGLVVLGLGLLARWGRPGDPAAVRFWRTTLIYATAYAGALSWTHIVVHPALAAIFAIALFLAPPVVMDFILTFPARPRGSQRGWRILGYAPTLVFFAGALASLAWAVADFRAGRPGDEALAWTVRFVGAELAWAVAAMPIGLLLQVRHLREATGAERSQRKWLIFSMALSAFPAFFALPVALLDWDRFLLVGYRPFAIAAAVLWFAGGGLAVLRVRLADVDALIHRSAVYALASGGAAAIYLGVVLGVGLVAERLFGGGALAAHLLAAAAAAALFGPIRARVTRWLDRRFFRDRLHYVQALRELAEASTRLREPRPLAEEVVERTVAALRATGGALYLAGPDGGRLALLHAAGEGFPPELAPDGALAPPPDGIAAPIRRGERLEGALHLGARRGGDLYSREDRDLVGALAGQLAVAFDNARAFETIAGMSRTLEAQNAEIRDLRDRLEDENRYLRARLEASLGDDGTIAGESKAVRDLRRQIERVAATDAVVLMQGESGTGKGLCARAIHAGSRRASGPFIHVDCGAIPATLFESELFGHERGAFTGAVRNRRGHFELADGGTLFLDEIGELPLALQPKLLRALQERSFLRVGGSALVTVDVRIVAATNRNLEAMVRRGEFREDLFYRLRVVELEVPPLRARKGDVPALVDFLLPRICRRNHKAPREVAPEAMARLEAYGWPGNVRELENVLERAAVLCEGRVIREADLNLPDAPAAPSAIAAIADVLQRTEDADHRSVMETLEKERLLGALRAAGGNQSHAARALGMARTTFINKCRRYGIG